LSNPLCELLEPFFLAIDDLYLHLIDDYELIIAHLMPVLSLLRLIDNEDLLLEAIDLIYIFLQFLGDVINRWSIGLRDKIVNDLHYLLLLLTQGVKGACNT